NTYYIVTNLNAVNFQLMKVDIGKAGDKANWQSVIPAREGINLEGVELFDDYLVYQQREMGQSTLSARNLTSGKELP
ncbi:oligopeptidase B, partial [Pseudoalteromonas sp. SIMBA_162]